MGLCVLYYVEYSSYNVKKAGFLFSGLELHFKGGPSDLETEILQKYKKKIILIIPKPFDIHS